MTRTTRRIAGVAALATTGVVGPVASPALAATDGPAAEETGLHQAIVVGDRSPDADRRQADAQQRGRRARPPAREKAEAAPSSAPRKPPSEGQGGARGQGARRP